MSNDDARFALEEESDYQLGLFSQVSAIGKVGVVGLSQ
jgi:hypothetical protein